MERIFLNFLVLRLLMALCSYQVVHQDETMQSVEVAHHLVFGTGRLTWEWLGNTPIRSIVYPSLFAIVFQALKVSGLDHLWLVALAPRLLQGIISAFGDYCFFKFYKNNFSKETKYFFYFYFSNCWMMHVSSRTLSNTMEMNLNNIALLYYSRALKGKGSINSLAYVALITLAFVIRVSTAVFWLPLVVHHMVSLARSGRFLHEFLLKMVPTAGFALVDVIIVIDFIYYGHFVFVPWNFVQVNIFLDISGEVFGKEPFTYYLFTSLPIMLNILLFYQPVGIASAWKHPKKRIFVFSTLWTLFWLSFVGHKETRFITPLIPLLLAIGSLGFEQIHCKPNFNKVSKATVLQPRYIFLLYLTLNVSLWTDVQGIDEPGDQGDKLVDFLASEVESGCFTGIHFFTCFPTPLFSHLHHNMSLRARDCSPVLINENKQIVRANLFDFGKKLLGPLLVNSHGLNLTHNVPSHIIIYHFTSERQPILRRFFDVNKMGFCKSFANFHVYSKCCHGNANFTIISRCGIMTKASLVAL